MIKNKSFTLIELLVVIVIIGILAGVIIVSMSSSISKANFAKAQAFSNTVQQELLLNLVSEWTFDNESNPGEDTWGNNDGTVYGSPVIGTKEECVHGTCLIFDGTNDYVDFGNLGNPQQGTIALWFYKKNEAQAYLLDGRNVGNWYLITDYSGYDISLSGLAVWNGLEINRWTFVVALVDSAKTKLYINGELKNSGNGLAINFSSVRIGTRFSNSAFFNGLMDDVRIYNNALTTSQIKQEYIAGLNSLLANNSISKEEYDQRLNNLAYDKE